MLINTIELYFCTNEVSYTDDDPKFMFLFKRPLVNTQCVLCDERQPQLFILNDAGVWSETFLHVHNIFEIILNEKLK